MISIVMSAYNASATINKAIDSVRSQSLTDWELIIVNDASTDDTCNIVLAYNDNRIKLINHSENLGAGLARRSGIEHIKGEWMTFLDSDDYISEEYLETLLFTTKIFDVDIVSPGFISVNEAYETISKRIPKPKISENWDKFSHDESDTKRFMNPMLIRSSLWDKVTYSGRRFIEDTPTLVQILYWAKRVITIDYAGYFYLQNSKSLIHTASQIKNYIYRALCIKDINLFFKDKAPEAIDHKEFYRLLDTIKVYDIHGFENEVNELYEYERCIKNIN